MSTLLHSSSVFSSSDRVAAVLLMTILLMGCLTGTESRFQRIEEWDQVSADVLEGKKDLKPELTDVSYLLAMQNSENPIHRRAALILLARLKEPGLHPLILKSLNDPDETVREESFRLALSREDDFVALAGRILQGRDTDLIMAALRFIRLRGKPVYREEISALFSHKNEEIRRRAAFAWASLFDENDPWFLKAQDSPDPLIRESTLTVIGYSRDPSLIPLVVRGFFDEERIVRDRAQFTILLFGAEALPYLEEVLATGTPAVQLLVLQVYEGMQEPSSLKGVIPLLFANDAKVRTRSRIVILSMKKEAAPELIRFMEQEEDSGRLTELIRLLVEIGDPAAIGFILTLLNHPEPAVVEAAQLALVAFGEPALPPLRQALREGQPESQKTVVKTLLLMNDPLLIFIPDTLQLDPAAVIPVLEIADEKTLDNYLSSTRLNVHQIKDLRNFKTVMTLLDQWQELYYRSGGDAGFQYYRQWEQNLVTAEILNVEVRALNHDFLKQQKGESLQLARKKRQEAVALEEQADDYAFLFSSLDPAGRKKGEAMIRKYVSLRKEIIRREKLLSPELRPLVVNLYENRGLNREDLQRADIIAGQREFFR